MELIRAWEESMGNLGPASTELSGSEMSNPTMNDRSFQVPKKAEGRGQGKLHLSWSLETGRSPSLSMCLAHTSFGALL